MPELAENVIPEIIRMHIFFLSYEHEQFGKNTRIIKQGAFLFRENVRKFI